MSSPTTQGPSKKRPREDDGEEVEEGEGHVFESKSPISMRILKTFTENSFFPNCIAFSSPYVYVAMASEADDDEQPGEKGHLRRFTLDSDRYDPFGIVELAGHDPFGVCLSTDKTKLFVSVPDLDTILIFQPQPPFTLLTRLRSTQLHEPRTLTMDPFTETLFVTSHRDKHIQRLSRDLKFQSPIDFDVPSSDLVMVGKDKMIVTEHEGNCNVSIMNRKSGQDIVSYSFQEGDLPNLSDAGGVTMMGELIAVTSNKNHMIILMTTSGKEVALLGDPDLIPPTQDEIVNGEPKYYTPGLFEEPTSIKAVGPSMFLVSCEQGIHLVKLHQPIGVSILAGLHPRAGARSLLMQLARRSSLFDRNVLRLPLRLGGFWGLRPQTPA